jgi:fucose 4-O-acetylase-like acetyltransferase
VAAAKAGRDPWLDNAKMALVTLVVIGHGWTLLPQTTLDDQLYDFLYAWHIPAFVFVTGYLSKGFAYTPTRMWQLFRTVVVPYLVFECAMALFRVHVGGEKLEDLFADPHWPMWYLSALFFWRLMTPVFRPMWGGAVLALVLSLAAGLWFGDTLDLARVFGLLPFFVLGLKARPEHLELLRGRVAKVAAVLSLAGILVLARFTDDLAATEWLYYRSRYEKLDVDDLEALLIRLAVIAIGLVGAMAFLALVPRVGGWFSRMGAYTLVVYLFHGFAVKGLEFAGFPGWAADHAHLALASVTTGALVLALLLAWRPVASRLQDAVDPFGYAERHARHAVAITAVVAEDEPDGPRMPSGGVGG